MMNNFELVDDYLANRLSDLEKQAFEQQLNGDSSLKKQVEFQRKIVEGVKQARMVELKTMLNNVPVGGSMWTAGKLATALVSAGVVATFMYLYVNNNQTPDTSDQNPLTEEVATLPDATNESPLPEVQPIAKDSLISDAVPVKEQEKKSKQQTKTAAKSEETSPVRKPDIQVVDPSDELSETEDIAETAATTGRGEVSASKMEVITANSDKKHTFHYQFAQGKLLLFGPFDKSLYEILEIHGDTHAVFLFYKENYYLLDQSKSTITSLEPIRESQLLKKLKEYHGR